MRTVKIALLFLLPLYCFGQTKLQIGLGCSKTFFSTYSSPKVNSQYFDHSGGLGFLISGKYNIYTGEKFSVNLTARYHRWKDATEFRKFDIEAFQATDIRFEVKYHGFFIPVTTTYQFKFKPTSAINTLKLKSGVSIDFYESTGIGFEQSSIPTIAAFQGGNNSYSLESNFQAGSDWLVSPGIEASVEIGVEKLFEAPVTLGVLYHYTVLPTGLRKINVTEIDKSSSPNRKNVHISKTKPNPNFLALSLKYSLFNDQKTRPTKKSQHSKLEVDKKSSLGKNTFTLSLTPTYSNIIQHNDNIPDQVNKYNKKGWWGYIIQLGYQRYLNQYLNFATGIGITNIKHKSSFEIDDSQKEFLKILYGERLTLKNDSLSSLTPSTTSRYHKRSYISIPFGLNLKILNSKNISLNLINQLSLNLLYLSIFSTQTEFNNNTSIKTHAKASFPDEFSNGSLTEKEIKTGYKSSLLVHYHLNDKISFIAGPEFHIMPIFQKLNKRTMTIRRENQYHGIGLRLGTSYRF